ncbi:MAG: endo-1,4-beta-xylanase [Rhizobiaceae bacterium]
MLTPGSSFAGRKIPFGVAVHLEPFRNDPMLKQKLIEHADVIVPMNALKWASLRYDESRFDFAAADEIIDFAEQNGKVVHGHGPLWYLANPAWLDAIVSPKRLEYLLNEHITEVVGRYAGRIASWDVVNEVISHDPLSDGNWRGGVWYNALGPNHVDLAFKAAAAADPAAKLYINDYDLQDAGPRVAARQRAMINILRRLQDRNIPVHGVGLQSHLYAEREVGPENLAQFIGQLKRMGLTVSVTELDVIDWKLTADPDRRDRGVAATAEQYLSALTELITPQTITTWGLCDRYSWINETFPREDGATARPLPFDRNWQTKPLFEVIKSFAG